MISPFGQVVFPGTGSVIVPVIHSTPSTLTVIGPMGFSQPNLITISLSECKEMDKNEYDAYTNGNAPPYAFPTFMFTGNPLVIYDRGMS